MCCSRLAANTGRKKVAKNRHLGPIAQLRRAISSQLRHLSTIGKKLVKQQYVLHLHMSPQYGELRPNSGWDRFVSLRHPCTFQRVSRLGSVTARHSGSGCQSNFTALNRGRHLYSAGRPSRWALAHISSYYYTASQQMSKMCHSRRHSLRVPVSPHFVGYWSLRHRTVTDGLIVGRRLCSPLASRLSVVIRPTSSSSMARARTTGARR